MRNIAKDYPNGYEIYANLEALQNCEYFDITDDCTYYVVDNNDMYHRDLCRLLGETKISPIFAYIEYRTICERGDLRLRVMFFDIIKRDTDLILQLITISPVKPFQREYKEAINAVIKSNNPTLSYTLLDNMFGVGVFQPFRTKDIVTKLEEIVSTDGYYSYKYARFVLKKRFVMGEEVIYNSSYVASYYQQFLRDISNER